MNHRSGDSYRKWLLMLHGLRGFLTFDEEPMCESFSQANVLIYEWILGGEIVDELYEYKNLGVLKVPSLRTLTTILKRLVVRLK